MKKLLSIGEALIDFIPGQTGCMVKDVESFAPKVGGAPSNVAGAFSALGGDGWIITQLGQDPFGDKIIEELNQYGIHTECVARTDQANTALAFVSLQADGNREFSFYRNPSADMLLQPEQIHKEWFTDAFALHFCSVSLGDFPMKEAHRQAITYGKEAGALISFDPNLRFPLWKDPADLKKAVWEFLPMADVLKVSDEELEFLTGCRNIQDALEQLFVGSVKMVIYTMGSQGAQAFTRQAKGTAPGVQVQAVDTTGAGDGFIGSFLYSLCSHGFSRENLEEITGEQLNSFLAASNAFCGKSVQIEGALASYQQN